MSKKRYDWWPYIKRVVKRYPRLCETYRFGTWENTLVKDLPVTAQREYEAVRRAVSQTECYDNGADRMKVVRLVLLEKSHTLEGAALTVPCGVSTAKRWHGEFVRLVAKNYGLLDEDETPAPRE